MACKDLAGPSVNGQEVTSPDHLVPHSKLSRGVVDVDRLAAGNARQSESAGDNRRVARCPAPGRQDALRVQDSVDVVRRGLRAYQDDRLLRLLTHALRLVRLEDHVPGGGAGRGVEA